MTKAPRPGAVKTRLQPPLTPEEAAALNACFLRDTAVAIHAVCETAAASANGVGVYTPPGTEALYETVLPAAFYLLPQRGGGFGQRLRFAMEDLLHAGFCAACLIDSDSPTVTTEIFREAAATLTRRGDRIVLGPSDDGGYYLIGMKQLHLRLFQEIDWSTERVSEQTVERAAELGLEVCMLPTCFDVDDHRTLKRLCDELLVKNDDIAPATRTFLQQIVNREGRSRIWPE